MSDSVHPENAQDTANELPAEAKGHVRVWLLFAVGAAIVAAVLWWSLHDREPAPEQVPTSEFHHSSDDSVDQSFLVAPAPWSSQFSSFNSSTIPAFLPAMPTGS